MVLKSDPSEVCLAGRDESARRARMLPLFLARLKAHPLSRIGPGLITGVADDDPSGIATYSQAGAQFGLNMLWTMPLAFPLMAAIQSMCGRIGRVTGRGLAANIKTAFPPSVLKGVVLLLLIANTLNIAADVAAMGEVGEFVSGLDRHVMTGVLVLSTLLLQIFVPYHRCFLPEMADPLALGLCRRAVHGPCALGRGGASYRMAASGAELDHRGRGRRRLWHDYQPLPLLLAGLRRGGGYVQREGRAAP